MPLRWLDLPTEIRLHILHYCFTETRVYPRMDAVRIETHKPLTLLTVSKMFANPDEVVTAILGSGSIVFTEPEIVHRLGRSLTQDLACKVKALTLQPRICSDFKPLDLRLPQIRSYFPQLRVLYIPNSVGYLSVEPQLLVAPSSLIATLAQNASVHPSIEDTYHSSSICFDLQDEYNKGFLLQGQASLMMARQCSLRSTYTGKGYLPSGKTCMLVQAATGKVTGITIVFELNLLLFSTVGFRRRITETAVPATFNTKNMLLRFEMNGVEVAIPQTLSADLIKRYG